MKRTFDLVFSVVGLLVLSPVYLLIALNVKLSDGGPVFFRQQRVGQRGRLFRVLKFRSMVANAEKLGRSITAEGDRRITGIGRFLRKHKLDELPQLWNVLVGDMSFVGPRPEVPRYVEKYTAAQRRVLELKPGITDLATLEFREEEEMLKGKGEIWKAEMLKTEAGAPVDGRRRKEEGGGEGKAEIGNAEMLKTQAGAPEDGRRRTEEGVGKGKAEIWKTEMLKAEDGVEEFYLEYCLPRKVELSLAYAARANVWTDVLIILRTLFPFCEAKGKGKAEIGKAESRNAVGWGRRTETDTPEGGNPCAGAPADAAQYNGVTE